MAEPEVACIWKGPNELGESPNWNWKEDALYWVDINGEKIQRLDPETDTVTVWATPMKIGSIVFRERDGLVAGMHTGFHFVDLETETFTHIVDPDPDHPSTRLSDGKCDRRGRYWCGSMNMEMTEPLGALYRLDTDLSCTKMAEGVVVSNGLGWSPDNKLLYYANSRGNTVYAFDFDIETGEIENRRDFIFDGRHSGPRRRRHGRHGGMLLGGPHRRMGGGPVRPARPTHAHDRHARAVSQHVLVRRQETSTCCTSLRSAMKSSQETRNARRSGGRCSRFTEPTPWAFRSRFSRVDCEIRVNCLSTTTARIDGRAEQGGRDG